MTKKSVEEIIQDSVGDVQVRDFNAVWQDIKDVVQPPQKEGEEGDGSEK